MLVHFTSDGNTQKTGWNANYTSTIIGIDENTIANSLHIYPNPNNGVFKVDFNTSSATDVELQILNLIGQSVYSSSFSNINGAFTHPLDLAGLSSGVYVLELVSKEGRTNRKIIIE